MLQVSRGKGCALHNMAGIYTKITNFLSWIHEVVKSGACKNK